MRLVVSTGSLTGRTLEVERRLVVGRDEGCELVLEDDEKVSRRHCAFSPNPDGTLTVEDLGSSNGTFVGGERISAPVVLRGGEEVRVGSTVLRAEGEQAGGRPARDCGSGGADDGRSAGDDARGCSSAVRAAGATAAARAAVVAFQVGVDRWRRRAARDRRDRRRRAGRDGWRRRRRPGRGGDDRG